MSAPTPTPTFPTTAAPQIAVPQTPAPPTQAQRSRALRDRWMRGNTLVSAEWDTIPRVDPVTGVAWGTVSEHRVAVAPALGIRLCDCLDWQHRRHLHDGHCKHTRATLQVYEIERWAAASA